MLLDEHIANYNGFLLTDLDGEPEIPSNSAYSVPPSNSNWYTIAVAGNESCGNNFALITRNPTKCVSLYVNTTDNLWDMNGAELYISTVPWLITAYADGDCSGDPVLVTGPDDHSFCKLSKGKFSSFSLLPLWNAQYRAFNVSFILPPGGQSIAASGSTTSTLLRRGNKIKSISIR
jgi:hypothetical protein